MASSPFFSSYIHIPPHALYKHGTLSFFSSFPFFRESVVFPRRFRPVTFVLRTAYAAAPPPSGLLFFLIPLHAWQISRKKRGWGGWNGTQPGWRGGKTQSRRATSHKSRKVHITLLLLLLLRFGKVLGGGRSFLIFFSPSFHFGSLAARSNKTEWWTEKDVEEEDGLGSEQATACKHP